MRLYVIFSLCIFRLTLPSIAEKNQTTEELLGKLDSLRFNYTKASNFLNENERARKDAAKKDDELPRNVRQQNQQKRISESGWLELFQNKKKTYDEYLSCLVHTFVSLPSANPRYEEIKKELNQQHPDNCKNSLTESWTTQHRLLAQKFYLHLVNPGIDKKKAAFFAKLTKPGGGIKFEDFLHFVGIGVEPQNWDVQNVYSLAALRVGEISTARSENKKLIRKATKYSRLDEPENQFNLRIRKELRAYKLHRALIEVIDGKEKEATKYLSEAMDIAPAHSPSNELKKIIDETKFMLGQTQQ